MIEQVRRRLDEAAAVFWTDEEINDWLQEAANVVARNTETLESLVRIDVDAGTTTIPLPTDVLRLHVVLWASETPNHVRLLPYVQMHSFVPSDRPGQPWCFTVWGQPPRMILDRPIYKDTFFYLAYYRTASGTTDIPAGWEDLLVDYAEFCALRKDRDPRWQEAKALFEFKLSNMIDTTRHWTDDLQRMLEEGDEFYFAPVTPEVPVPCGVGWDSGCWDDDKWVGATTGWDAGRWGEDVWYGGGWGSEQWDEGRWDEPVS